MNIYTYDCDGTLQASFIRGPIPTKTLRQQVRDGHVVVIVSDSPFCSRLWKDPDFNYVSGLNRPEFHEDPRTAALLRTASLFPIGATYYYISDNPGDDERARVAGFEFFRPEDFQS